MFLLEILISLFNLLLCVAISIFSYLYYTKNKQVTYILVSFAFALFGMSHILPLLYPHANLFTLLVAIRTTAYLLIILNLFKVIKFKWYIIILFIITTSVVLFSFFYINTMNRVSLVSLTFCIIISLMSYILYKKTKTKIPYYLAMSFVLFSITHILTFWEYKNITVIIITIRFVAYLLVCVAFYRFVEKQISDLSLKYLASNKFQMFLVATVIAITTTMFYFPHFTLNISDPIPQIKTIRPKTIEQQTTEVKTGLYIKNFPLFDMHKNEFIVNTLVWFKFDPHSISLDSIGKFSFERGTILKKSEPETKIINGKLFSKFKVKIKFKSNLDYQLFPFEDHRINLILINTFLNPDEVIISSQHTNLTSKQNIFTGDWKMFAHKVKYGYSVSEVDKYDKDKTSHYPTVIYSLDFIKQGFKKTFLIFIPLFLAFLLSIFSLIINIKNISGILALSVGSISALIYDLFIISNLTPTVSYFTISDSILTMLLISVFTILFFNIYVIKQTKTDQKNINLKYLILIKSYLFLFFMIFIPLLTYHFLYYGKAL